MYGCKNRLGGAHPDKAAACDWIADSFGKIGLVLSKSDYD
jgi:hypothetical protein